MGGGVPEKEVFRGSHGWTDPFNWATPEHPCPLQNGSACGVSGKNKVQLMEGNSLISMALALALAPNAKVG